MDEREIAAVMAYDEAVTMLGRPAADAAAAGIPPQLPGTALPGWLVRRLAAARYDELPSLARHADEQIRMQHGLWRKLGIAPGILGDAR